MYSTYFQLFFASFIHDDSLGIIEILTFCLRCGRIYMHKNPLFTCYRNPGLLAVSKSLSYTRSLPATKPSCKRCLQPPASPSVPATARTDTPTKFPAQGCSLPPPPVPPARRGKAGNARRDGTVSFDYLWRKSVFGTLLLKHLPPRTLRTPPQTERSTRSYTNLGYSAEKPKKGG